MPDEQGALIKQQVHDDYHGDRWQVVTDHLSGDVLDQPGKYLIRKEQGEGRDAYNARKDIASYVPHYSRAVLSLAGMVMQNEESAARSWWEGGEMGSPDEDGIMARLWRNADGRGTDWEVMLMQALVHMIGHQRIWGIAEGIQRGQTEGTPSLADARSDGRVRVINPLSVKDWIRDETGRLVQVKVEATVDKRGSVLEKKGTTKRWHVYSLDGVEVYEEGEDGVVQIGAMTYGAGEDVFRYIGRDGRPVLPVWTTVVPLSAPVGWMMARYATWLYNFRNVRNFHLWSSALARAWIEAIRDGQFDEQLWEKVGELLSEGSTFFPTELGYSAPPMDGAETRNSTLETERDDFYTVFFQSYGDAAKERTATEIRQDIAQGVQAYLTLQAKALDEWENAALWRIAQVHMPGAGREVWGQASVTRSTRFEIEDIEQRLTQLRETLYGRNAMPVGTTARLDGVTQVLDRLGIDYDPDEVITEIERRDRQESQRQAFNEEFGTNL